MRISREQIQAALSANIKQSEEAEALRKAESMNKWVEAQTVCIFEQVRGRDTLQTTITIADGDTRAECKERLAAIFTSLHLAGVPDDVPISTGTYADQNGPAYEARIRPHALLRMLQ